MDYQLSTNTSANCNQCEDNGVHDISLTSQQVLIQTVYQSISIKVVLSGATMDTLIVDYILKVLEVFSLVSQILKKDLMQFLDRIANEVYVAGTLPTFPYRSFGEAIHLAMISMLRELLSGKKGKLPF